MAQILLISPDYIYQNTDVNTSVEAAKMTPYIRLAQDMWIEPLLGTKLMNKIKDDSDDGTIAGNYLTLRNDYLRPALVWFTYQEMLPSLNYKIDNGSIAQHNSENTSAVGMTEMNRRIEDAKKNSRFYAQRLQAYLCDNSSFFPELNTNTGSEVTPTYNNHLSFMTTDNNHDMGAARRIYPRYMIDRQ
jgi:hypothetical protein